MAIVISTLYSIHSTTAEYAQSPELPAHGTFTAHVGITVNKYIDEHYDVPRVRERFEDWDEARCAQAVEDFVGKHSRYPQAGDFAEQPSLVLPPIFAHYMKRSYATMLYRWLG